MRSKILRSARFVSIFGLALLAGAPARAQTLDDPSLYVETIIDEELMFATAMAFVAPNDILVLEKSGTVRRILNGVLQPTPVLTVIVNASFERGLLGIAVNTETPRKVFLYYTEAVTQDGTPLGNRVYRYTWNAVAGLLQSPQLLLDLPAIPASNHVGGTLVLGPPGEAPGVGDGALLYAVIGDLNLNGKLQNNAGGAAPDDSSVILRIRQDGSPAPGNPFTPYCSGATTLTCDENADCGGNGPCRLEVARYFAYGVRNSFGMAIDPVTGQLWNTENGSDQFDEVNRVTPGFNSGWNQIMGPDALDPEGTGDLWNMPGAGSTYSDPEFTWTFTIAPTGIAIPVRSALGPAYNGRVLVGDYNRGSLHALPFNKARTGFDFTAHPLLTDLVADNWDERDELTIGVDFGRISDLEFGPDGALYVLSLLGTVYRITAPSLVPALRLPALALLCALLAGSAPFLLRRARRSRADR